MRKERTNAIASFVLGVATTVLLFSAGLLTHSLFVPANTFNRNSDLTSNSSVIPIHIEASVGVSYDIADLADISSNYARSATLRRLLQSVDEVQLGELLHQSARISNEYVRH